MDIRIESLHSKMAGAAMALALGLASALLAAYGGRLEIMGGAGVLAFIVFWRHPQWAAAGMLALSPLLDQMVNQFHGGFRLDTASFVRGGEMLAMLAVLAVGRPRLSRPAGRLLWATLALAAAMLCSLPLSPQHIETVKQVLAFMYWAVFLVWIDAAVRTPRDARIVAAGQILAGLVILATMAPYEIHHVYSVYTNGSRSIYGPYRTGPFNLALSIAFWFPLLAVIKPGRLRTLGVLIGLGLLDVLLYTFVRTALLVTLVEGGVLALRSARARVVGAALAAAAMGSQFHRLHQGWVGRLMQAHTLNGFSSGRIMLNRVAWERFARLDLVHQLVGIGYGTTQNLLNILGAGVFSDPQNDFLNVLIGAGVLGLSGLVVYLGVLWSVIRRIAVPRLRGWAELMFGLIVLVALINGVFGGETTAMMFAVTAIGMARFWGGEREAAAELKAQIA